METRMMDVNRLYQSPCHRSFPPEEKQGIFSQPTLRLPWQCGRSVKEMLVTFLFFGSKLGDISVIKCLRYF